MNTVKPVPPPQSIALSSDRARRHAEVERLRRDVGFEVDDPQTCLYVQANGTRLPRPHGLVELSTPTDVWRALTTRAQESKLPLHVLPLLGDLRLDEVTAAGPWRSLPDLVRPLFARCPDARAPCRS